MKDLIWMAVGAVALVALQVGFGWAKAKWTAWRAKVSPLTALVADCDALRARVEALETKLAAGVASAVKAG